jgi:SM-20-related protein
VCYLNSVPLGGELVIYDEQDQFLLQVQPSQGSLVMFESERFPHEVKPAQDVRYSIAGWFRKD